MRIAILCLAAASLAAAPWTLSAQQTVAPTTEPVEPVKGQNVGNYNILNSFETGYRFLSVDGDLGKYRSDVNYGNGLRLLSSDLRVHSLDGHGALFDDLVLNTQGLGTDPYRSASLRIEKNRLYRYDLQWRSNDYFNPALTLVAGAHILDTQRRLQDHDFTLFPNSGFRFFAGYTRDVQDGPALSTVLQLNALGDIFPVFANIRRLRNEYRVGSQISLAGVRFTWMHGWDNYSETTPYSFISASPVISSGGTTLSQFGRAEPYSGSSPYWRLNLYAERKYFSAAARYTWVSGERGFSFNETAAGSAPFTGAETRQILVAGNARRPVSAGSLSLTGLPGSRLTIVNNTSFSNTRMEGNAAYTELNNATLALQTLDFQLLGIRTISNATDVTFRATDWIGFYGGYHYSTRRVRSVETFDQSSVAAGQTNTLHSGLFGIRLQLLKPLSVNLNAQLSRADRPFYPVADRNFHALGGRVQYKTKAITLAASARTNYNVNSVSLSSFSSRSRNYGLNATWAPRTWVSLDAAYSKMHLDTMSGIAYFASGSLVTTDRSIYISNIHMGNLMARFSFGARADLAVGYTRVQDTGDGRSAPAGTLGGASLPVFLAAQTFPLSFESPLARFSWQVHSRVRWNVGYQFYHYREEFLSLQNYRAHTGFTSLLWSF